MSLKGQESSKHVRRKKSSSKETIVDRLLEVNSFFLYFVILPRLDTLLFHVVFPTIVFYQVLPLFREGELSIMNKVYEQPVTISFPPYLLGLLKVVYQSLSKQRRVS